MKSDIANLLQQGLQSLCEQNSLPADALVVPQVDRARNLAHGDFATNVALVLAKPAQLAPRVLAEKILAVLDQPDWLDSAEIAGPGFINFRLAKDTQTAIVTDILAAADQFGCSQQGQGESIHIEYVSANPTGPLHIGHGRGAVYGSAVANVLQAVGYQVHREYYVNDAGRQMDILATSIWLRYLELVGESVVFPANGYQGDYIKTIAATVQQAQPDHYHHPAATVFTDLPADAADGGDKEHYIDALIARAKQVLGAGYQAIFAVGLDAILAGIRTDLADLGVEYDQWYAEQGLFDRGTITQAIDTLDSAGHLYTQQAVRWFRASAFGDEKDRVLVRDNGQPTYFASDVAYHIEKLDRGYTRMINIWGADHHGYVPRVRAALQAAGRDPEALQVLLVQFATLYENGVKQSMSTRSGEFVTLRTLYDDVGVDATRFFYLLRRSDQHLEFDLAVARAQSNDNPVYYVQYAHARICAVLRQATEQGMDIQDGSANLSGLTDPHEVTVLKLLARYPEVVATAARDLTPHLLTHYLRELAQGLHTYYNACQFLLADDKVLSLARLTLIKAIRQVLCNGLRLLGVSAPDQM